MARPLSPIELIIKARDASKKIIESSRQGLVGWARSAVRSARDVRSGFRTLKDTIFSIEGAIAGLLGAGMVEFVRQAVDSAEALDKMSQRVGVSVERLSTLTFAAEQSGSNLAQLEIALKTVSKQATDTANGTGEARTTFAALGIDVRNSAGEIKSAGEILDEVADKFSRYEDGASKSAAAQRLFGESGAALIPLLNQGSEGIARLEQKARDLGAEIDTNTAKKAAEFTDRLNELATSTKGLGIEIISDALPALNRMATAMSNAATQGGLLKAAVEGLSEAWDIWSETITGTGTEIGKTKRLLDEIDGRITQTANTLNALRRNEVRPGLPFVSDPDELEEAIGREQRALRGLLEMREETAARLANLESLPNFSETDLPGDSFLPGAAPLGQLPATAEGADPKALELEREREHLAQLDAIRVEAAARELDRKGEALATAMAMDIKAGKAEADLVRYNAEQKAKYEHLSRSSRLRDMSTYFGAVGTLTGAFLGQDHRITQIAHAGKAAMATEAAAVQALAQVPYPANFKVAAKTRIAGYAGVAGILGTAFGSGGSSGGGGFSAPGDIGVSQPPTFPGIIDPISPTVAPEQRNTLEVRLVTDQTLQDLGLTLGEIIQEHQQDGRLEVVQV